MTDIRFEICPNCGHRAATETDIDYEVYRCEDCEFLFFLPFDEETNAKDDDL